MKKLIALIFIAYAGIVWANCDSMVALGKPEVKATDTVAYLCRRMYVLEHSSSRHTAYWSAEHLLGTQQGLEGKRVNAFRADPDLPAGVSADPADYVHSGYDRGHMSPVGDMHVDALAMLESFYMSNMVPQIPGNNRVGWRTLENYVRAQAIKNGEIFVVTGPIYQDGEKTIGTNKVAVPSHLYKIIYFPKLNEALTFVVPNVPFTPMELPKFVSDLATVEQLTNIKFFPKASIPVKDLHSMYPNSVDIVNDSSPKALFIV